MKPGGSGVYPAFDLGATSWRAVLGRDQRERLEVEEIARKRNAPIERNDGLFWDLEGIYQGVKLVLRNVAESGLSLAAIGIDSWSIDYGLPDQRGSLLEKPRSYRYKGNLGMRKKAAP